jgi:hypothetical protein
VTRRIRRACIAVGFLLTVGASLIAAAAPRIVFGAGVLRRDGIIIPFAAFDGKQWRNAWPAPTLEPTVPIDVRGIPSRWWGPTPSLDHWQAWTGGEPQNLRVLQPDWVEAHCLRQIGLRTDYRPAEPAPPLTEQPYPKDGLAVSPAQPVEPIAIVRPESEEARGLLLAVHEAFNKAERATEDAWGHPVSRRAREGRAPDLDAIYAFGDHPRIYYVEAIRRYRLLGQAIADCEAVGFGTGWFAKDGNTVNPLRMTVDLLNCERRGANYMLPLGAMRIAGKLYWLAQYAGWNNERYVVVEIKPKTVEAVVSAWGGSCQR